MQKLVLLHVQFLHHYRVCNLIHMLLHFSYKLIHLLSHELAMSISVHPSIKSVFETGSGGCRYYIVW